MRLRRAPPLYPCHAILPSQTLLSHASRCALYAHLLCFSTRPLWAERRPRGGDAPLSLLSLRCGSAAPPHSIPATPSSLLRLCSAMHLDALYTPICSASPPDPSGLSAGLAVGTPLSLFSLCDAAPPRPPTLSLPRHPPFSDSAQPCISMRSIRPSALLLHPTPLG